MKKVLILLGLFLLISPVFANYDLQINDRNITYNENELKFYENDVLLNKEQVQELFPEYEIVLISRFDKNKKIGVKNSLVKSKKVLLLNDTNRTFHNFFVYPTSSRDEVLKYKKGEIKSLFTIYGKKNVRLKHSGGDEFEIIIK